MNFSFLGILVLSAGLFTGLGAQDVIVDGGTKESFPRHVSFEEDGKLYELDATGVATRKKLIIKVYSIAHYLQQGALKAGGDPLQVVLSDGNAKQFTLKWVRGISPEQARDAFQDSFHKVLSEQEYAQQQGNIDKFLQFFSQGVQKGDETVLRAFPDGKVEVILNGKKAGEIADKAFAKNLWSIWFGANSVVDKKDLLSQAK